MAYQIECTQTLQSHGRHWVKRERMSVNGWTVTLASEDDANTICGIMSRDPGQPYILQQHEYDAPVLNVVEGGLTRLAKPLAEVIELLGQHLYYNSNGTKKTDEEIYGEKDAEWIRERRTRSLR